MSRAGNRFLPQRGAGIGAALAIALVGLALLAPVLTSHDPLASDVERGLSELGAPLPPSHEALLGTDPLGRDVWARVVYGGRTSLSIAALATALATVIGVTIGLVAGSAGGAVDGALMRLVDLVMAFPFLLLSILLAALFREADLASSIAPAVFTLGAVGWTAMARVVRGKTRALVQSEMVVAARAIGAGPLRIAVRHVLPNAASAVIVIATLGFAQNLLAESVLSYLGLGAAPPTPSWGRMLYDGRAYYRTAPHLVIVPGLAIVSAVAAFHLVGEGLRAAFDRRGDRA